MTRTPLLALTLCSALACSSEDGPLSGASGAGAAAGAPSTAGASGATGSAVGGRSSGGQAGVGAGHGGSAGAPSGGNGASSAGSASGGSAAGEPTGGNAAGGGGGVSGNNGGGTTGDGGGTPIKVWLAGDSTVQQCSGSCPCGWGSQLDALFNEQVTVVNRAVGGRSVQTWLYDAAVSSTLGGDGECSLSSQTYDKRWRDMLDSANGMQPGDYLLIQFGINDGDRTCPRHVGVAAFESYLSSMAQAAKERGAQAVFVTPVSAIACSGGKAAATRGVFVDATKAAATASGAPLIDLHRASMTLYDSLGFCPNDGDYGKGQLGAFFCKDHTHFEAEGAAQVAELVAHALKTQAPGLAAYLR